MDLEEIVAKNNAELPEEDRLASNGTPICAEPNDNRLKCTRSLGHTGDHVAHGVLAQILARWPRREGKMNDARESMRMIRKVNKEYRMRIRRSGVSSEVLEAAIKRVRYLRGQCWDRTLYRARLDKAIVELSR